LYLITSPLGPRLMIVTQRVGSIRRSGEDVLRVKMSFLM